MKTAIVLAFDHLPARWLGCYGNVDDPTPNIDRFAASSIVFDQHFATATDPPMSDGSRAAWQSANLEFQAIFEQDVVFAPSPQLFESRWELLPHGDADGNFRGSAGVVRAGSETVQSWIESADVNRFLWMQATGVAFATEETTASSNDGAMAALDSAFGEFWDAVCAFQASSNGELLLIVTANEGMGGEAIQSLPEGVHPPTEFARLSEAVIHTPMIVHATNCEMGTRRRSLTQTSDLWPTLHDWFQIAPPQESTSGLSVLPLVRDDKAVVEREYICFSTDDSANAIRTRDWLLQTSLDPAAPRELPLDSQSVRLFVKPDDLWEIHNVTDQEPDQAQELLQTLHEHFQLG